MNLSAPFIHRPVMTTFVMLAIAIAGWMAFGQLPVSDLPAIDRPTMQVTASYTGASPDIVLNQITIPLEKELTHVKGVEKMESKSSRGFSSITMEFPLSKNMDEAVRDVQAALNRVEGQLPKGMTKRPTYHRHEGSQGHMMYLILTSDKGNVGELRTYSDAYILPRLNRIEGVAQVETFGTEKSIWIRLNPELMASRKIGFNQVVEAIEKKTAQLPLGTIETGTKTLALEMIGSVEHAKDLENISIGDTAVRIKDIGEVSDTASNEQKFYFVTPDKSTPALIIGIQKIGDANTVAISEHVRKIAADLEKELPSSIQLNVWFDKAVWIQESIHDVEWSLFFAFALVIIVIYLSLGRMSEAMIPSMALPMSLLGTFIVMYLLNYSLDLLSLLALTLSVGFVVDDAIVMLENIVRHQENGEPPRESSLKGSRQVSFTILSMTLSLVAVFIPLLFMEGVNGRLFREFSITLAVAILVSGFISLTLTPMLCSRFLSFKPTRTGLQKVVNDGYIAMIAFYGKTLRWCFRYPKSILGVALFCVAVTVPLFMRLPVNLIPPEDRGFLITVVNLPTGISKDEIKGYQNTLDLLIQKNPHVENFLDINFDGNLIYVVRLLPLQQRPPQPAVIADLQESLNAIPGIQAFTRGYQLIDLEFDISNGGKYKLVVKGPEIEEVEIAAENIVKALKELPYITFAETGHKNDTPKLLVHVNEDHANQLGFSKQQIQEMLQKAYGQGTVGTIQKWGLERKIFMELQKDNQHSTSSLEKLHIASKTGSLVPVKAFAHWEEKLGSPSLNRQEQLAAAKVKFSLADTVTLNEGLQKVEDVAAGIVPHNVSAVLDGSAKSVSLMIRNTLFLLLAAAVVMYIVLGILYESFIHPLTILSSLPFASLGGVLTLFIFNEPISIFSAVGFLLLIGIVKKNGIMMIDYALEAQKEGKSSEEAIFEGCMKRFRPIMMTTIAAIMGAIPIAIGFGDGGEMRQGLGLVIVGGLIFSQILTLYVTPILYLAFDKLEQRYRLKQEKQL